MKSQNLHFANRRLVIGTLAVALTFCMNFSCFAQGIALLKSRSDEAEEFWTALRFQSIRIFTVTCSFQLAGKPEPVVIEDSNLGPVIELPDLAAGTFVSEPDFATVAAKRRDLEDLAKRCRKAAPTLQAAARELQVAEEQFAAGKVLQHGRWLTAEEWRQVQATENPKTPSIATLTVNGQTFREVRLMSCHGNAVGITHVDGAASLQASALSTQQIAQLNATSATVKIDPSPPQSETTPTANQTKNQPSEAKLDPVTRAKLSRAKAGLADVESEILTAHERWTKASDLLSQYTGSGQTPPRQGTTAYHQWKDASRTVAVIEKEAPKLIAEKQRLEELVNALERDASNIPSPANTVLGAAPIASTSTQSVETKLPTGTGEGPKEPGYGWACTAEEQHRWEMASKEECTEPTERMRQWFSKRAAGANSSDEPVLEDPIPKYSELLEFINSRIGPFQLGYNASNGCLILRNPPELDSTIMAAFAPEELNAMASAKMLENQAVLWLESRKGDEVFTFYGLDHKLWRNPSFALHLPMTDLAEAERVARAFRYLLVMLGAHDAKL